MYTSENMMEITMELTVIENDHVEVKKYLTNFVPNNYYKVLGDDYLYQIRATLLHSVSHSGEYSPKFEERFNELSVAIGSNTALIRSEVAVWGDLFSIGASRTDVLEVDAANANAAITEIRQATASQNQAQASINNNLQASLDDIVVGGRNLIINSTFEKGYEVYGDGVVTPQNHYIGKMHKVASNALGSFYGIQPIESYKKLRLVQDTQYSLSFYGYGNTSILTEIYLVSAEGVLNKLPNILLSADLSERRHITFRSPIGGEGIGFIIGSQSTKEDEWFSVALLKLELGTKPSDWTPAPEDVDGYIASVQASINEFKDVQINSNNATASYLTSLDSRVGTNSSSISSDRITNASKFASLTTTTDLLLGKTGSNSARIEEVNTVLTTKYETSASKIQTLEADNQVGKGKIENLETVTANNTGVIASTSSSLSARIDGIAIGGRNLLRNASFLLGYKLWGTAAGTNNKNILGNLVTVSNMGDSTNYFGIEPLDRYQTINIMEGKDYVLSFYVEGSISELNDIWLRSTGNEAIKLDNASVTTSLNERTEIVFTAPYTAENCSIIIGASGVVVNEWFAVVAVKFEQGNKATDWTEAPEDTRENVDLIEADITAFKEAQVTYNLATTESVDTLRTTVGNNTASITNNYNTLTSKDTALANNISSLTADFGTNKASVTNSLSVLTDKDTALTSSVESLTTNVGNNSTAISTETTSRVNAIEAVTNLVTNLDSDYKGNKASVANTLSTLSNADVSLTSSINSLTTTVGSNTTKISQETTARTTEDAALGNRITTVDGKTDNALSRINTVETVAATNTSSIASTKTELTAAYKQAIDSIEIGGRNIALNSKSFTIWGSADRGYGITIVPESDYTSFPCTVDGSNRWTYGYPITTDMLADEEYTISVEYKADTSFTFLYRPWGYLDFTIPESEGSEWNTYSRTFKNNQSTMSGGKLFTGIANVNINTNLKIKSVKIEKGNKATAWTAAPEDVEAAYTAAISTEATARSTAVEAVANTVTALDTRFEGNKTSVTNALTVLADKDTSLANSITALTTTVGNNTTAISTESTARSTADTAIGNRITTVEGKTENALSRIITTETAISDTKQSMAQQKTDITAEYKTAIDDIEIDSNNKLLNSNFSTGDLSSWGNNGGVIYAKVDGYNVAKLGTGAGIYQNFPIIESKIYSYSFRAKALDDTTKARIGFLNLEGGYEKTFNLSTEWKTYSHTTLEAVPLSTGMNFHVYSEGKPYYITDFMVVAGTKAVGWLANTKELAAKINTVEIATANNTGAIASSTNTLRAELNTAMGSFNKVGDNILPTNPELYINYGYRAYKFITEQTPFVMRVYNNDTSVNINDIYVCLGASGNPNNGDGHDWIYVDGQLMRQSVDAVGVYPYLAIYPPTDDAINRFFRRFRVKIELGNVATAYSPPSNMYAALQEEKIARVDSVKGLYAQYTVKLDVGGRVSGFGLMSGSKSSEFAVVADNFYIAIPGLSGIGARPFRVENNIVYMNEAVIKDGSINLAKINTASINNLSALSANIGHFKSAETGARLEIKDSLLSVYDSNNRLRVRLGLW